MLIDPHYDDPFSSYKSMHNACETLACKKILSTTKIDGMVAVCCDLDEFFPVSQRNAQD